MASKSGKPTAAKRKAKGGKTRTKAADAKPKDGASRNPLLAKWTTPFEMPPFDRVKAKHFMPAFDQTFADNIAEIEAIANDPAKPTFANTIEALERAGRGLDRAAGVFYNLAGTDTNDEIQKIEREVAPRFAKHGMRVYQNAKLFRRVDALFKKKGSLGLSEEQARVLERYHRSFIRSGAALDAKARKRMAAIAQRLATLGTKFNQNVLADEQELSARPRKAGRACRAPRGSAGGCGTNGH